MRIAITGGSGSVGRAIIAEALLQGHSLVNIDRVAPPSTQPGVPFVQAEMSDYEALVRALCQLRRRDPHGGDPHAGTAIPITSSITTMSLAATTRCARRSRMAFCASARPRASMPLGCPTAGRRASTIFRSTSSTRPTTRSPTASASGSASCRRTRSFAATRPWSSLACASTGWSPSRDLLAANIDRPGAPKSLWAYTLHGAAARACLHEPDGAVQADTRRSTSWRPKRRIRSPASSSRASSTRRCR